MGNYKLTKTEQLEIQEKNALNGWTPQKIANIKFFEDLESIDDYSHLNPPRIRNKERKDMQKERLQEIRNKRRKKCLLKTICFPILQL